MIHKNYTINIVNERPSLIFVLEYYADALFLPFYRIWPLLVKEINSCERSINRYMLRMDAIY